MGNDKFVEVKNLKKVYNNGHEAIKDVSFSVKKRRFGLFARTFWVRKNDHFKYIGWFA